MNSPESPHASTSPGLFTRLLAINTIWFTITIFATVVFVGLVCEYFFVTKGVPPVSKGIFSVILFIFIVAFCALFKAILLKLMEVRKKLAKPISFWKKTAFTLSVFVLSVLIERLFTDKSLILLLSMFSFTILSLALIIVTRLKNDLGLFNLFVLSVTKKSVQVFHFDLNFFGCFFICTTLVFMRFGFEELLAVAEEQSGRDGDHQSIIEEDVAVGSVGTVVGSRYDAHTGISDLEGSSQS